MKTAKGGSIALHVPKGVVSESTVSETAKSGSMKFSKGVVSANLVLSNRRVVSKRTGKGGVWGLAGTQGWGWAGGLGRARSRNSARIKQFKVRDPRQNPLPKI